MTFQKSNCFFMQFFKQISTIKISFLCMYYACMYGHYRRPNRSMDLDKILYQYSWEPPKKKKNTGSWPELIKNCIKADFQQCNCFCCNWFQLRPIIQRVTIL